MFIAQSGSSGFGRTRSYPVNFFVSSTTKSRMKRLERNVEFVQIKLYLFFSASLLPRFKRLSGDKRERALILT